MRAFTFVIAGCLSLVAGCGSITIEDVANRLISAVDTIQTEPQTLPPVLEQEGDTIIIDNSVTVIDNPAQDLTVVELPDRTVLGLENDTGWDIYIQYLADGDLQGVYVYDGEALLLEYPCLSSVELLSEDDVDPSTGLLADSFDLTGTDYSNPADFVCGDAFILNFDPTSVGARTEVIDLAQ